MTLRRSLEKAIARSQKLLLQVLKENSVKDINDLENKLKERLKVLYESDPDFMLCWSRDSTLEDEILRLQYFGLVKKKENHLVLTHLGEKILEKEKTA